MRKVCCAQRKAVVYASSVPRNSFSLARISAPIFLQCHPDVIASISCCSPRLRSSSSSSRSRLSKSPVLRMATGKEVAEPSPQPKNFRYYQLYASDDGTTHFGEWKMTGFDLQAYSSKPQYVRSDFGGEPTKLVFTELAAGLEQPLHSCPAVQFVVTLSGSWYVKTTDGTKFEFKPGDVLFQDNTKNSPANTPPEHFSGVIGDEPCQQMIVQLSRPPQVNEPNPF
jgi:hypothetical protein